MQSRFVLRVIQFIRSELFQRLIQPLTRVIIFPLLITACSNDGVSLLAPGSETMKSDIESKQHVVFFNTSSSLDKQQGQWRIPIHGWIYEPQDSTVRKAIIEQILESAYDLHVTEKTRNNFNRRINLLIADNEGGNVIVISIAGQQFVLPESGANGHFVGEVRLSVEEVARYSNGEVLIYNAVMPTADRRVFSGQVRLIPPEGISVISDIDDTVKVSQVTDHKKLFENTFYKDFIAVTGMSELYQAWSRKNVSFHYVSSSPWHLYSPLMEFFIADGFPWATYDLKMIRLKDETILNLFKKGTETKPQQIEPILKRYPARKFILIGDNGEQDPEVYAGLIRKYPAQIIKILIRNLTNSSASDARYLQTFADIKKNKWQLFNNPSEIKRALF